MLKTKEERLIYYDHDLKIETYQLSGIVQKFPNHFHDCYVFGFIENGRRHLCCKGQEYDLSTGDMILFNPQDNHLCFPLGNEPLDYRALNIGIEVMQYAVREITGQIYLPHFKNNVIYQSDITAAIDSLYLAIVNQVDKLQKEEALFFLLEQLLQECSCNLADTGVEQPHAALQALCLYMQQNYMQNITLDELASLSKFSKSYLLRFFTKQIGVSPYRYLQNIRLNQAKKLLEKNIAPLEVAIATGFADQSHFTNYFKEFIGLTPKQYQKIFTTTI